MKNWYVLAMALAWLASCRQPANTNENNLSAIEAQAPKAELYVADTTASAAEDVNKANRQPSESKEQSPPPEPRRQIIKTANLTVSCTDFDAYGARLQSLIRQHGGWIASEEETKSDEQLQNVVCIKVPVAAFDQLVNSVGTAGGKLESKKVSSEDVTNAIVDSRGRLEAKKQIRARYLELLKQARTMEEILQVQGEINSITEELESTAYNLEHMQAQAAYSTIYLTYYQWLDGSGATPGFGSRLWDAVRDGGSAVMEMSLSLVALWPLWLLAAGGFYWWRSLKAARMQVAKQAAS